MTAPTCHAGACHDDAADHGVWGWLCSDCWAWVERFRARFRTPVTPRDLYKRSIEMPNGSASDLARLLVQHNKDAP